MIIEETKNSVIKSENLVEREFTIKSCSKAFKILSDKLYSDKIGAVVRELSTNAYDSHIEANNPNPFDVHFPNMIEPYFYIRDYGTGISPENIISVYCDFFNSTRSDSNEMVGMLGLGSKSPFSYTDKFSVTSWYNGRKYIYSAYINETGVPSITEMFACDTNEPNGLEVKFPVNSNDFREFSAKIETIFPYFKIKPNIMGLNQSIPEIKYIIKGNGWGVRNDESRYRYSTGGYCRAIMGNISYPISAGNLGNLTDVERGFLYSSVDMNFNIGEIDIAASREQLSYDDVSIRNIKRKIEFVRNDMVSVLNDTISSAKTLWDARVIISKWRESQNLVKCPFDKIEWNGKKVCSEDAVYNLSHVKFINKQDIRLNLFSKRRKTERTSSTDLLNIGEIDKDIKIFHMEPSSHEEIKCFNPRLKKVRETFNGHIFIVECFSNYLDTFREMSGFDSSQQFVSVKDLPYDKVIRTTYKKSNDPAYVDSRNGLKILEWDYEVSDWVKTDKVLSSGGVYLPINRYKIVDALYESNFSYMKIRKDRMESCFKEKVAVYGIKEKYWQEVKDNPKWVHFNDYFLNKVYNEIKDKDILEGKYYSDAIREITRSYHRNSSEYLGKHGDVVFSISYLCNDVLNNEIINNVNEYNKYSHLFQHVEMEKLLAFLNITTTFDLEKYVKEVTDYAKNFIEQYPMVKLMDNYSIVDSYKNILDDYIKSCSVINISDSEKKIEEVEEVA